MSRFADDGYDEIDELIDTDPIELGRRYRALLAKYEEISKAKPSPTEE